MSEFVSKSEESWISAKCKQHKGQLNAIMCIEKLIEVKSFNQVRTRAVQLDDYVWDFGPYIVKTCFLHCILISLFEAGKYPPLF